MNTKKCKNCEEIISKTAKRCKHCATWQVNWFRRNPLKTAFIVFLFFFVVLFDGIDTKVKNVEVDPIQSKIELFQDVLIDIENGNDLSSIRDILIEDAEEAVNSNNSELSNLALDLLMALDK